MSLAATTFDFDKPVSICKGAVLGSRYELIREIGSGTFGDVWEAIDLLNGYLRVAIKLLHDMRTSPETRARFARECSALELLVPNHHIVAIRERGSHMGRDYMVMELLEGPTLRNWLNNTGAKKRISLNCVADVFEQLCLGLDAAHSVNSPGPIVHRDLKPENIVLLSHSTSTGMPIQVKILDFGLVRLGDARLSFAGQQLGTPLYMAPEQILGNEREIGPWTDVFALGIILIEMLTLRATGPDEISLRAVVAKLGRRKAAQYFQELRPDVPQGFWDVALRALAIDPTERYKSAGEMLNAFRVVRHKQLTSSAKKLSAGFVKKFSKQAILLLVSALLGATAMRTIDEYSMMSPLPQSVGESSNMCIKNSH